MAITENGNELVMPVAPMGGYGNNGGFGGFGGDWGWIVLLLLLAGNGGWGMGGFGGGYGNMMLGYDFPWLLNGQNGINNNVSDGFRDAQLHDSVTSVRDGVSNLATQLCGCCGDITAAITGAQTAVSQQLYSNEIASLNRSFAEQTANMQGFNGVQSSICDIRYGNANNTRDILTALTAGVQSIKDQLCQDKIDAKNDEIAQLRQENLYARGQASQVAQNAAIINGIYDRLNSCPVGTVPVYGEQPIFTCPNGGCGCGNGSF